MVFYISKICFGRQRNYIMKRQGIKNVELEFIYLGTLQQLNKQSKFKVGRQYFF